MHISRNFWFLEVCKCYNLYLSHQMDVYLIYSRRSRILICFLQIIWLFLDLSVFVNCRAQESITKMPHKVSFVVIGRKRKPILGNFVHRLILESMTNHQGKFRYNQNIIINNFLLKCCIKNCVRYLCDYNCLI